MSYELAATNSLRLEIRAKNNVLFRAIYERYGSVSELCRQEAELNGRQVEIGKLLNFSLHPIAEKTGEFRKICKTLEEIFAIDRVQLFPIDLYDHFRTRTSFTALEGNPDRGFLPAANISRLLADPAAESARTLDSKKILSRLSAKQRFVIERRFGFYDGTEWTNKQIGEALGCSTSAACALVNKTLRFMQSTTYYLNAKRITKPTSAQEARCLFNQLLRVPRQDYVRACRESPGEGLWAYLAEEGIRDVADHSFTLRRLQVLQFDAAWGLSETIGLESATLSDLLALGERTSKLPACCKVIALGTTLELPYYSGRHVAQLTVVDKKPRFTWVPRIGAWNPDICVLMVDKP